MAVAAVAGSTVTATPVERPTPVVSVVSLSAPIDLTASSQLLSPWPSTLAATAAAAEEPSAVADQIDESFIDVRSDVRTDFHAFANRLGYLGKQLYVGFNFGESIVASAIFNGTDILRGEGLLRNLGQFTYDVVLAAAWVVADELYLHVPGLPPIDILPNRPPGDPAPGWVRPLPPRLDRPLVLPVNEAPEPAEPPTDDAPAGIDDSSAPDEDADAEDVGSDTEDAGRDTVAAGRDAADEDDSAERPRHKPARAADKEAADEKSADEPTTTTSDDSESDGAGSSRGAAE